MADFEIRWLDDEQRFEPAKIRAELVDRGTDVDLPLKIDDITFDPVDVIELVVDDATTPTTAVFRAQLTREVLADERFYDRIKNPITVEITATPIAEQTASIIFAAPVSLKRSCTVAIDVPPARIHWRVRDVESDAPVNLVDLLDPAIEVEADGEHTIELEVWVERYLPATRTFGKDDTAHFTHMTGKMFRPRIFGPHEDSLPWVVAKPGSGNRRTLSLWRSNAWLPDARHPETVPLPGHIWVKAWGAGDIEDRPGANMIRPRPGATPIVEQPVPVRLVPIKVAATRELPTDPIPADGLGHEVTLRFTRARTGRLLRNGEVSWELPESPGLPGGTIEPRSKLLTVEDGGRVKFTYGPPALRYEPGGCYDQELIIFSGRDEHRDKADGEVVIHVSPEVRARLQGKKQRLDFEPSYGLSIPAGQAPEEVIGHHGLLSLDSEFPDKHDVFDAVPLVQVETKSGISDVDLDVRTDKAGTYHWKLPELAAGLAHRPPGPRRQIVLEPFVKESAADLDQQTTMAIAGYRSYIRDPGTMSTFGRLLSHNLVTAVNDQPKVTIRQLSQELESDSEKVMHGLDLVQASLRGTVIIDGIHARLFDQGIDLVVKFAVDLVDYLIRVKQIGTAIGSYLLSSAPARWAGSALSGLLSGLASIQPAIARTFPALAQYVESVFSASSSGGSGLAAALARLLTETQQILFTVMRSAVEAVEQHALGMLVAISAPLTGEATAYAAKKSAEKTIKEIVKAVLTFLGSSGSTVPDIVSFKNFLRTNLPLGVEGAANDGIGTTNGAVGLFRYPFVGGADELYLATMHGLKDTNVQFGGAMSGLDEFVSKFGQLCDIIAVIAVIAAIGATIASGGAAAPISFAGLSALSIFKLKFQAIVHLGEGLALLAFLYYAVGLYRETTIGLTAKGP